MPSPPLLCVPRAVSSARMCAGGEVSASPLTYPDPQPWSQLLTGACEPEKHRYDAAITLSGKAGQWRAAMGLLHRMVECGHSPGIYQYNRVATSCARAGKCDEALALLNEVKESRVEWDAFSFSTAMSAHSKRGGWQQTVGRRPRACIEAASRLWAFLLPAESQPKAHATVVTSLCGIL